MIIIIDIFVLCGLLFLCLIGSLVVVLSVLNVSNKDWSEKGHNNWLTIITLVFGLLIVSSSLTIGGTYYYNKTTEICKCLEEKTLQ